jgi:hypothetical protein
MNKQIQPEIPEENTADKVLTMVKAIASEFPALGTLTEFFELFFAPSIEKRREVWFENLAHGLIELQQKIEEFEIEQLQQNETFITTFMGAYGHAIRTHREEKRQALRNAVLNATLPDAPDDTKQKMFIEWIGELTPYHLKILQFFNTDQVTDIDLDDRIWRMNIALDRLADSIIEKYPELENEFDTLVQIIHELHLMGLISNKLPAHGLATEISPHPKLTPLAIEFLDFIQSPIEKS